MASRPGVGRDVGECVKDPRGRRSGPHEAGARARGSVLISCAAMRRPSWTSLSILVSAIAACSPSEPGGSGGGTDSEGSSGGSSSSASATTGPATTDPGGACVPGQSVACACPNGTKGAQVCNAQGSGFEPCECADPTTGNPTTSNPTTADPSTTDATATSGSTGDVTATTEASTGDGSTGGSGSSTGGGGGACMEMLQIEMAPDTATLSGAWQLGMSMLGEGQIINIPNPGNGTDGSILYAPDIPCDATWYIWVRVLDNGSNDSYFATLDGEPNPAAIFEGDCTNQGNGYKWAQLNWRDPMANACQYVEDPWAPMWTAGAHEIAFTYREAQAMGRILLTNDPNLVPN